MVECLTYLALYDYKLISSNIYLTPAPPCLQKLCVTPTHPSSCPFAIYVFKAKVKLSPVTARISSPVQVGLEMTLTCKTDQVIITFMKIEILKCRILIFVLSRRLLTTKESFLVMTPSLMADGLSMFCVTSRMSSQLRSKTIHFNIVTNPKTITSD